MNKKYKHLYFYFLVSFLFVFFIAFYLPANKVFAVELEVLKYPTLSNNSTAITSATDAPEYLKYVFDFGMVMGIAVFIFSLAWASVLYFLSPAMPNALAKAKDRVVGAFTGLLILLLAYLIVVTINPSLATFKTTPLNKIGEIPELPPTPGVFLYNKEDCPKPDYTSSNSGIADLATFGLDKKLKSVKILNDTTSGAYFFAIAYEQPKFRGKCLVINYDANCYKKIDPPFASSIDIYKFGNGKKGQVTIYRNSSFDSTGGSFTIPDSQIRGGGSIYKIKLEDKKFEDSGECNVPEEERDCIMWSNKRCDNCVLINGKYCEKLQCPTLAGKNIGSVKVEGDYLVLFVYFDPKDSSEGPWTFCQSFPTPDDINKDGPRQIKWEDIYNINSKNLPNYMYIFPLEKSL